MSWKLVVVTVLALQVSLCLCEVPEPEKELVEKYEELRGAFYKRLLSIYGKAKEVVGPMAEGLPQTQTVKEYIEELQAKPEVQSAVKIVTGVAQEVTPLVDKARTTVLGLYGHYVRPWAGSYLDQAISTFRAALHAVAPLE
ncbi:apolipoprotein A-II [Megalops cyprinoides]|uniref:apolipoprotein A-II n=1 Tax=Megalops cyprinoides TaxID=118141 RepID=UPI001864056B|nr:apolipoprotein A-II [Megalops cyprinoides]